MRWRPGAAIAQERTMDFNLTLVIQGLAFFAVAWLVMKFGWPNIMAAIEERQAKIAEGLAAADRSKKDLAQAEERVNEQLREARTKAAEIIAQAEARANQIIDAAKEEAIAEGNRQKAAAQAEILALAGKAREELRRQVSQLAVAGAEKLIRREIDSNAHKALLDELAAEI
jgi:F-type H+-transporting ATPase subunit b